VAVERQGYCPLHPKLPPARSGELPLIVAPGANYAYDVLAQVGLAAYLDCHQGEEIRAEMACHHHLEIPSSTVSYLARKFVAYFQIVHQESIGLLRARMHDRGGYILHIDGTCEEASRVLLIAMDSLSGQVLESRKIGSENEEEVRGVLKEVRRHWGLPMATVHDLKRCLITAVAEVFPGTPQFVCHYHLAADVGKDILSPHEDHLRRLFRRTKVRPKLRALVRSLKVFAVSEDTGQHRVTALLGLRSQKMFRDHCTPEATKGAVHALASWVLAFSQDGEGYGFPFDMPYLNFYDRVLVVHQALSQERDLRPRRSRGPLGPLKRLGQILDTVVEGEEALEFRRIVRETRKDLRVFHRFRAALRVCPKGQRNRGRGEDAPGVLSARRHKAILEGLRASLNRQARRGSPSERASRIVVEHLDKYWPYLFGHVLRTGSKRVVVPRTNNVEEDLIGVVKCQCRRLHGRGHLSRDIEVMSPAVPLILNLNNPEYCQTVYGGREPEKIAERFSLVDPQAPARLLKVWKEERISRRLPRKLERLKSLPRQVARFLSVAVRELAE